MQTCLLTPSDEILLSSLSKRFVVVLDKTSRRKAHRKRLLLFFSFLQRDMFSKYHTSSERVVPEWGYVYFVFPVIDMSIFFLGVFLGASYKLPISKAITPQCVVYRVISHSLHLK